MIVSRQAYASGVDDSVVVDPEAHLSYDMRTATAITPSPGGERGHVKLCPLRRHSRAKVGMGEADSVLYMSASGEAWSYGRV